MVKGRNTARKKALVGAQTQLGTGVSVLSPQCKRRSLWEGVAFKRASTSGKTSRGHIWGRAHQGIGGGDVASRAGGEGGFACTAHAQLASRTALLACQSTNGQPSEGVALAPGTRC